MMSMLQTTRRFLLRKGPTKDVRTLLLHQRHISIGTILFPPAVFGGLLISLWTIKSISLVIFQNRVIYMPYLPPFTRNEEIPPPKETAKIQWERIPDIRGANGVKLATCRAILGKAASQTPQGQKASSTAFGEGKEVVVLYLQGNAGSAPMRLPLISKHVLSGLQDRVNRLTFIYPSYRGYWQSSGRANPRGMRRDIPFILNALKEYQTTSTKFIIWGESIGSVISVNVAAEAQKSGIQISGLILETPFPNIAELVRETYPQRWLPYYYLTPFLYENWSMKAPLASWSKDFQGKGKVLILNAERDELVGERLGKETTNMIKECCGSSNVEALWVAGAGHQDCLGSQSGPVMQKFIETI